jgi:hypothetical protein
MFSEAKHLKLFVFAIAEWKQTKDQRFFAALRMTE